MRALALLASTIALLSCGTALAQVRGVPVEAFTPPGMHLVGVDVPEVESIPVRLRFASSAQGRAEVLVDVLLAADAPSAGAAAAWFRDTVAGELPPIAGLGDRAVGDAGLVAFVRDHAFIRVSVLGAHDPLAIARAIDRAIDPAIDPANDPSRGTGATPVLELPAPQIGAPASIEARGALALHVTASAPGHARRTRSGWLLSRSAPGPIELRVVIVDRLLRRTEHVATLP